MGKEDRPRHERSNGPYNSNDSPTQRRNDRNNNGRGRSAPGRSAPSRAPSRGRGASSAPRQPSQSPSRSGSLSATLTLSTRAGRLHHVRQRAIITELEAHEEGQRRDDVFGERRRLEELSERAAEQAAVASARLEAHDANQADEDEPDLLLDPLADTHRVQRLRQLLAEAESASTFAPVHGLSLRPAARPFGRGTIGPIGPLALRPAAPRTSSAALDPFALCHRLAALPTTSAAADQLEKADEDMEEGSEQADEQLIEESHEERETREAQEATDLLMSGEGPQPAPKANPPSTSVAGSKFQPKPKRPAADATREPSPPFGPKGPNAEDSSDNKDAAFTALLACGIRSGRKPPPSSSYSSAQPHREWQPTLPRTSLCAAASIASGLRSISQGPYGTLVPKPALNEPLAGSWLRASGGGKLSLVQSLVAKMTHATRSITVQQLHSICSRNRLMSTTGYAVGAVAFATGVASAQPPPTRLAAALSSIPGPVGTYSSLVDGEAPWTGTPPLSAGLTALRHGLVSTLSTAAETEPPTPVSILADADSPELASSRACVIHHVTVKPGAGEPAVPPHIGLQRYAAPGSTTSSDPSAAYATPDGSEQALQMTLLGAAADPKGAPEPALDTMDPAVDAPNEGSPDLVNRGVPNLITDDEQSDEEQMTCPPAFCWGTNCEDFVTDEAADFPGVYPPTVAAELALPHQPAPPPVSYPYRSFPEFIRTVRVQLRESRTAPSIFYAPGTQPAAQATNLVRVEAVCRSIIEKAIGKPRVAKAQRALLMEQLSYYHRAEVSHQLIKDAMECLSSIAASKERRYGDPLPRFYFRYRCQLVRLERRLVRCNNQPAPPSAAVQRALPSQHGDLPAVTDTVASAAQSFMQDMDSALAAQPPHPPQPKLWLNDGFRYTARDVRQLYHEAYNIFPATDLGPWLEDLQLQYDHCPRQFQGLISIGIDGLDLLPLWVGHKSAARAIFMERMAEEEARLSALLDPTFDEAAAHAVRVERDPAFAARCHLEESIAAERRAAYDHMCEQPWEVDSDNEVVIPDSDPALACNTVRRPGGPSETRPAY